MKLQNECKAVDKSLDEKKITDKHSTLICRPSNYVQLCTKAAEKTIEDDFNKLSKYFLLLAATLTKLAKRVLFLIYFLLAATLTKLLLAATLTK